MATRFLELRDGVIVEIGTPSDVREEMHTSTAEQVDTTMEIVGNVLTRILEPIGKSFGEMHKALNVPIEVASAVVELGLCFSAEGNLFVTKAKAEGTINVKIEFTPVTPPAAKKAAKK